MESSTLVSNRTEAYLTAQMERAKAQDNPLAYNMLAQRLAMAKGAKVNKTGSSKGSSVRSSPAASPRSTTSSSTGPSARPRVTGLPRSMELHMHAGAAQRITTKQVKPRPQNIQRTATTSSVPSGKLPATSARKAAPEKLTPVVQKQPRKSVWDRIQWPSEKMEQGTPPLACDKDALPLTEDNLRRLGQLPVSPVPCAFITAWPADRSLYEWPTPDPGACWMELEAAPALEPAEFGAHAQGIIARPQTPPPHQRQKIGPSACSSPSGSAAEAPLGMTPAEDLVPAVQPATTERATQQQPLLLQNKLSPRPHECCKEDLADSSCHSQPAHGVQPADAAVGYELHTEMPPAIVLQPEHQARTENTTGEGFLLGCIPTRVQISISQAVTAGYCAAGKVAAVVIIGSRLLRWR